MKRTFWGQIWRSLRHAYGGLVTAVGIPVSIAVWIFKPNDTISLGVVLPLGFLFVGALITLSHASWIFWENTRKPIPRVLHARRPPSPGSDIVGLCLLEPSELLSQGHAVSFYIKDEDGFEVLIGIGAVLNVQDDERILVALQLPVPAYISTIDLLLNNDRKILEQLRVKPNIPQLELPRMIVGGNDV